MFSLNFQKFIIKIEVFILLSISLPSILFAQTSEGTPAIIITEIGVKETAENEWLEIYNKSEAPVDLTGWKFFEDATNHGISVFRGKNILQPGEYAVIANKADLLAQKYPDYTGTLFDSSWGSLKEEGEEIGLKDSLGAVSELFAYPAFKGNSISLERVDFNTPASEPTNWAAHPTTHSLGKPNEIALPTQITASEPPSISIPSDSTTSASLSLPSVPEIIENPVSSSPEPSSMPPSMPSSLRPNNPPKAIIQIQSGELIAMGQTTVNFDGRASFDPDGDKLVFRWDMGDGMKEETANPSPHKYDKPGTYRVTLTVIDPFGASDQMEQYVQVVNGTEKSSKKKSTEAPGNIPSFIPLNFFPLQNTTGSSKQSPLIIEIRGSLTFDVAENQTAVKKKIKKKTSKNKTSTSAKKESKRSKKKKFLNGDLSDAIKITELLPDPSEKDEEWIELFNNGETAVNLGNWQLVDTSGKTEKVFTFPDNLAFAPSDYFVLRKSETKLSLNNSKDQLDLRDYEGNTIDTVRYEGSKKGYSYALVEYVNPVLVASADPRFLGTQVRSSWEWVSPPTPQAKNQRFEIIEGVIEKINLESEENLSFSVHTKNDQSKTIHFTTETLDLLTAQTVLQPKSSVKLNAQLEDNGNYLLKKIEGITPPADQATSDQSSFFTKNIFTFLMIPGVIGAFIICTVMIIKIFKT